MHAGAYPLGNVSDLIGGGILPFHSFAAFEEGANFAKFSGGGINGSAGERDVVGGQV